MTSTAMILPLSRAALHKWLRFLALCMVACAGLAASLPAQAQQQCTITSSTPTISFGTVTVPRDAPVGAAIGPLQSSTASFYCPANPGNPNSGWYLQYYTGTWGSNNTVPDVWDTGLAGIGIRVIDTTYNWTLSQYSYSDFAPPISDGNAHSGTVTFTYQLIKTAAQVPSSGWVNITELLNLRSHNIPYSVSSGPLATISVSSTQIVVAACTVTTPSINVALPPVTASTLNTVGATGGDTSFNIGLSCQSGANVHVTLTDATTPGNTTSNLTLAAGSTASGVKLRVLRSGAVPVNYGPDSALPGNTNQWLVGASAGTTQIPLTVQYISTGPVTPGTVKGLATFTMSYQ